MWKFVNLARFFVLALVVVAVYPVILPLLSGSMTWGDAVGVIASDHVITLLVIASVLGLIATLARNKMVRTVVGVGGFVLVILIVQGTISLNPLHAAADAYAVANSGAEAAERCGYKLSVEQTGQNVRAVLRDPTQAEAVVGYVAEGAKNTIGTVFDAEGNVVNPTCR